MLSKQIRKEERLDYQALNYNIMDNLSAERYEKNLPSNPEMVHNKILSRVQDNSRVLEFGPASGVMTRELVKRGCKVDIVEIDKECFEKVLQIANDGYCGDIETYEWKEKFQNEQYDYILFTDVLEHLRDPERVLKNCKKFLRENGSILISIPNIAHNSVIISMLNNHFTYHDTGILDTTHIRFYTLEEMRNLIKACGYKISLVDGAYIAVGKNEFPVNYSDVPENVKKYLQNRPFGEVYQFVFEVKHDNIDVIEDNRLGSQQYVNAATCAEHQAGDNLNTEYGDNTEIARMRLEINELYNSMPELYKLEEIKKQAEDSEQKHIDRILQLQTEVEERNKHLKVLDEEIENNRNYIAELKEEISSLWNRLDAQQQKKHELWKQNDALREKINKCSDANEALKTEKMSLEKALTKLREEFKSRDVLIQELQKRTVDSEIYKEKEEQIADLQQTIRNKEGHIELLLETEREYEREKNSRTYRMALAFRRISTFFLPAGSKRRFLASIFAKFLRHPIKMLRMVNVRRVKNCMTILKTEDAASAAMHLQLVEDYEKAKSHCMPLEDMDIVTPSDNTHSWESYADFEFVEQEKPLVSIIIPAYNQFDYTYNCLQSILKYSDDIPYEVIIADDCSTDYTQKIEEKVHGIRVIHNASNLRFLRNCNNAADYAKGEYILFLNNDTQVQKGWLESLVRVMDNNPKVGMTGSKLIYPDGYLQEAGGILWKDASAWNYGNRSNPQASEFNYVKEVDYISGAAIMIRTKLWKEIGGFDERFAPAYCEDSDLAFEVRKHGYKVVYQPQSVVVHFEGISNGTDVNAGQKQYQVTNCEKFKEKWKQELSEFHFKNGTNVFVARDRSRKQKHVLVIDHYVPQYDKDAGSKTTYMYLKMLVSKGYHITFLGDNFYQHEPYTTTLQQMGIFVLYGPWYAEHWKEWLKDNIQFFDIFYLNRPHITVKYIDFIKENAKGKVIYYGHDLHFLRIRREYELTGDESKLKESEDWMAQELAIMRKTDMNYYPSVIEEEAIHEIDASIPVKAITAYVFEHFEKKQYKMEERQGLLFVGGFGHDPNLDAVLWFLDNIYPAVYAKTKAPFYIVGSKAPEAITKIKTEGVIVKGFVSEEELQNLYQSCRVAVVPLRYGAGVKGKVVEALYYGIPVVTTSVGAEGINGMEDFAIIKDSPEELISSICNAYEDASLLKNMSSKSQLFVEQNFSTDAVWNIIKDDFS